MKNIIKFLSATIIAIALAFILSSMLSRPAKAQFVPAYGTLNTTSTFTLVAGAATIADTRVTATSSVIITLKTVGGTIAGGPYEATITPGTGFTVAGGGGSNTSVYNYVIVN